MKTDIQNHKVKMTFIRRLRASKNKDEIEFLTMALKQHFDWEESMTKAEILKIIEEIEADIKNIKEDLDHDLIHGATYLTSCLKHDVEKLYNALEKL